MSETEETSGVLEQVGEWLPFLERIKHFIEELGAMAVLTQRAVFAAVRPPYELRAIVYQIETLGARSLPIASLTATFAGLVISLQFGFFLAKFGVQHTTGRVVVLTLFRELAPVLTALTVGGRIGSGIAAELGSMRVTEQVDAIRALGADPIKKLVVPRVLACLLVMPALTILADVFGLVAGGGVVKLTYGIPYDQFFQSAVGVTQLSDFLSGVLKGVVFGGIISMVGCYKGINTTGGTEGVGTSTTQTVAVSSVAICLADFFLTKLMLAFE